MLLLVDCTSYFGHFLAAPVFFNVRIVCKSPAEISPPICTFMELFSKANLPCLVHLALNLDII